MGITSSPLAKRQNLSCLGRYLPCSYSRMESAAMSDRAASLLWLRAISFVILFSTLYMRYIPSAYSPFIASSLTALVLLLAGSTAWAQTPANFAAASTYPAGSSLLAVADINADGRPDLVTANSGSNTVSVLLGQPSGGFTSPAAYGTGGNSQPVGVTIADVNADGRPDILTTNGGSNTVGVLLGQASGGFIGAFTYSTGANSQPVGVVVADVNADGRLCKLPL